MWRVPRTGDLYAVVRRHVEVTRWLVKQARRPVGPEVRLVGNRIGTYRLRLDERRWATFLSKVYTARDVGVVGAWWSVPGNAHAIVILVDARVAPRLHLYLVDPNGEDFSRDPDFEALYGAFRRELVATSRRVVARWLLLSKPHAVHSFMLHVPAINSGVTDDMRRRDRPYNIALHEVSRGLCQPWSYVFLLDVLCASSLVLTRGHFLRLVEAAGGESDDEEVRAHSRLMFLRATLGWIAEGMRLLPTDTEHVLFQPVRRNLAFV